MIRYFHNLPLKKRKTMPDNLETDINNLVDAMPEPRDDIDTTAKEAVDGAGTIFNAEIHSTGPDGTPSITKGGRFRKKKGASAAKSHSIDPVAQASRATGAGMAEAVFALGQMLGGSEWTPIIDDANGIDERTVMYDAFTAYVRAKNISDVPAGVALSIALIAYAVPRFSMPKTQTRLGGVKKWIKKRWVAWRG